MAQQNVRVTKLPEQLPQSSTPRPISWRQRKAAQLLFEDRLTDENIAAECGITKRALTDWKKRPDVIAEVDALYREYSQRVMRRGIAVRARRVEKLNELHDKLWQVVEDRACDPSMQNVPGGRSGMVVGGEVDTSTSAEIRNIQKQAAMELGQCTPEQGGVSVGDIKLQVVYVDADGRQAVEVTGSPDRASIPDTVEEAAPETIAGYGVFRETEDYPSR